MFKYKKYYLLYIKSIGGDVMSKYKVGDELIIVNDPNEEKKN